MAHSTQISKWGNSLAVRIPTAIAKEAELSEGDPLSVRVAEDGSIVIRPARRRYKLEDLLEGMKPSQRHPETDWGPPRGREVW